MIFGMNCGSKCSAGFSRKSEIFRNRQVLPLPQDQSFVVQLKESDLLSEADGCIYDRRGPFILILILAQAAETLV